MSKTERESLTSLCKYPLYKSITMAEEETRIIEASVDIEAERTKSIMIANKSSGKCVDSKIGTIMSKFIAPDSRRGRLSGLKIHGKELPSCRLKHQ